MSGAMPSTKFLISKITDMKKSIASLATLLVCTGLQAQTEGWIDLTSLINNPGFDSNTSGWTITQNGSQNLNYQCLEFYNGTFNIYQEITGVENGTYRIGVQAFYRTTSNTNAYNAYTEGTEDITAKLFANDTQQPLVSVYSWSQDERGNGSWWSNNSWGRWDNSGPYYPNDMQSASEAFAADAYHNTMEFEVTDNSLRIGLINESNQSGSWCIFDNFTLEYYGQIISVTSLSLSSHAETIGLGNTVQLTASVIPVNATIKGVTWSTSDAGVATVNDNGLVTATGKGTCTITATSKDNESAKASCTITVTRDDATAGQLIINEIQTANIDQFVDPSYNFGSWMELYNPTDVSAYIGGYYLSDDADNLKKWFMPLAIGSVPAKGYLVIWFDHSDTKNTNCTFDLEPEGGTIYISDSDGQLITSQTYPEAISRTSYARTQDGGDTWGVTDRPTPGSRNSSSTFYTLQLDRPVVDKPGQFFSGSLTVSVNIPSGASLLYTTDGSLPTLSNNTVSETGIFTIDTTTVFRFRLFQNGHLPSEVVTRTYIADEFKYGVPVVSVVTDPDFLYSDTLGIYVRGTNGRRGRGQSSPANWNQDWDRAVNFEYFVNDEEVLNQEVRMAICGGWSRGWQPKSFKLKGNKVFSTVSDDGNAYHINTLNYPFFKDKPYIRNRTLQNRNAGNDIESSNPGRMTDAVIQRIALTSGIDLDGQSAQPIVVYMNGKYVTIDRSLGSYGGASAGGNLNMREPNNKHYVYANYGLSGDEIDMWEMSVDSCYVQMCGDKEAFNQLYQLSANAADDDVYEQIKQLLDIDEYINYNAMELYLGCSDWPHNNIKAFRSREGGRFRHIVHDIDWCFRRTTSAFTDFENTQTHTFYPLFDVYDENGNAVANITTEVEYVTIFLNLLQNEQFRKQFIDMYCIMGGSVYEPTRSATIIDDFAEEKRTALSYDGLNPTSTATTLKNNINNRLSNAITAIRNYSRMQLSGVTPQAVTLSVNNSAGHIFINDLEVPQNYFNGQLFAPVTLKAEGSASLRFLGWKDLGSDTQVTIFPKGSDWSYYDQGSLDDTDWTSASYDDSSWATGSAPLGYNSGNTDLGTIISYGSSSSNKYTTYYFRRNVHFDTAPASDATISLNYGVDDGFVVYVNGTEAGRYNMPDGTISYSTVAPTYADVELTGTLSLDASLFQAGDNVIAVEVHNQRASSSDIRWDASLTTTDQTAAGTESYYSTEAVIEMPTDDSLNLQACFERLSDDELSEAGITPLRINEVSAANSIYVNDYYKKKDWVEIYNTTDSDIDLEGMYLSDNADKPYKYQITKGTSSAQTIVPAGGFAIIWCDKEEPVSQLHASFKLAAEGGDVLLTAADKSWTDTFHYPAHNGDQTVGRYPNGSDSVYVMNVPTIQKSNIMSSYAESYTYVPDIPDTPDAISDVYINSDGGMRIYMADGAVIIRDEEAPEADVSIYTLSGQLVLSTHVRFDEERAQVGISALPNGTYVTRAHDTEGNRCSLKFLAR